MPDMDNPLPRDFVGYGAAPPHPHWPSQARLALNFVINIEEGAERSILQGDNSSENYLLELTQREVLHSQRDYFSESIFEYGSRCGIWRLLKLFEQRNLAVTAWVCGQALECNPLLGAYLHAQGHEIAGHGYRWINYREVDQEIERAHIAKTIAIIEHVSGEKPHGGYTGRRSEHTQARHATS